VKPEYIIIHHSATKQGGVESFRRAHKAKGWRDVGYHYIIGNGTQSKDGEIEKGRAENDNGAHCPDQGMNFKSLGICLVGNLQEQKPTEKQMHSLEILCRELMKEYGIPYTRIKGHGEIMPTNCPGKNFNMASFRNKLKSGAVTKKDYEGHWAQEVIKKAMASGIMNGYPDGNWKPDEPVTRAELAVVLQRIETYK
jgi:N-acetylmuramoyl-L-alanine amidase